MKNGNDKSLESRIWDATCSIRGAKDAPKYKEFNIWLAFTKRLYHVFNDELDLFPRCAGLLDARLQPHSRKPASTRSLTHLQGSSYAP